MLCPIMKGDKTQNQDQLIKLANFKPINNKVKKLPNPRLLFLFSIITL